LLHLMPAVPSEDALFPNNKDPHSFSVVMTRCHRTEEIRLRTG
jgi:hypothetical protein